MDLHKLDDLLICNFSSSISRQKLECGVFPHSKYSHAIYEYHFNCIISPMGDEHNKIHYEKNLHLDR